MRASISTWRTGDVDLRISAPHFLEPARRVLTNSVLVRGSTIALPRLDRMRALALPLPGLDVSDVQRCPAAFA